LLTLISCVICNNLTFCSVPEISHTLAKVTAQKQKTTTKQQNKKVPAKLNPPAGKLLQTSQLFIDATSVVDLRYLAR